MAGTKFKVKKFEAHTHNSVEYEYGAEINQDFPIEAPEGSTGKLVIVEDAEIGGDLQVTGNSINLGSLTENNSTDLKIRSRGSNSSYIDLVEVNLADNSEYGLRLIYSSGTEQNTTNNYWSLQSNYADTFRNILSSFNASWNTLLQGGDDVYIGINGRGTTTGNFEIYSQLAMDPDVETNKSSATKVLSLTHGGDLTLPEGGLTVGNGEIKTTTGKIVISDSPFTNSDIGLEIKSESNHGVSGTSYIDLVEKNNTTTATYGLRIIHSAGVGSFTNPPADHWALQSKDNNAFYNVLAHGTVSSSGNFPSSTILQSDSSVILGIDTSNNSTGTLVVYKGQEITPNSSPGGTKLLELDNGGTLNVNTLQNLTHSTLNLDSPGGTVQLETSLFEIKDSSVNQRTVNFEIKLDKNVNTGLVEFRAGSDVAGGESSFFDLDTVNNNIKLARPIMGTDSTIQHRLDNFTGSTWTCSTLNAQTSLTTNNIYANTIGPAVGGAGSRLHLSTIEVEINERVSLRTSNDDHRLFLTAPTEGTTETVTGPPVGLTITKGTEGSTFLEVVEYQTVTGVGSGYTGARFCYEGSNQGEESLGVPGNYLCAIQAIYEPGNSANRVLSFDHMGGAVKIESHGMVSPLDSDVLAGIRLDSENIIDIQAQYDLDIRTTKGAIKLQANGTNFTNGNNNDWGMITLEAEQINIQRNGGSLHLFLHDIEFDSTTTKYYFVGIADDGRVKKRGSSPFFSGAHVYRSSENIPLGSSVELVNGEVVISSSKNSKICAGIVGMCLECTEEAPNETSLGERFTSGYVIKIIAVGDSVHENSKGFNVCNENGDIEPGDLLVTSSTPGYLMKQDDDIIRSCTVGKAMENVEFNEQGQATEVYGYLYCG